MRIFNCLLLTGFIIMAGCHPKIKVNTDEVYSRHLQKHISITVISTPVPKNRNDFNLLLLNDGQAMQKAGIEKIVDTLNKVKLLKPLIIVGIDAFDPVQEYGVVGYPGPQNNGALAEKYSNFIVNELLPFIKTKSKVRSFNSVTIAGSGMSGISAIDIAWDNWQKFDKVAFLPDFLNGTSAVDFSLLAKKILQSRKRPKVRFWLDQMTDIKNPQRNDSTGMKKLVDVLKTKGQEENIKLVGIEGDKNRFVPFKDSFTQFLFWINETY